MSEVNGQLRGTVRDKKPEEPRDKPDEEPERLGIGSLIFGRPRVGPPRPLPIKQSLRGKRRAVVSENPFPAWMDVFTTTEASVYCHYRTPQGLRKAWYNMEVFPQGRKGGRGTLIWKRSELDRFLRGAPLLHRDAAGIMLPPRKLAEEQREES